ncbi:hypothetical protein [Streptomyces sp. CBG33]|uniref:hypothetical protein n=1 Tax=Streptomyces sp. CBG33 TaxID=2762624 RepID=UPI0021BD385D|nr:hypothetical protein [Streptomyces sp. CBG33]
MDGEDSCCASLGIEPASYTTRAPARAAAARPVARATRCAPAGERASASTNGLALAGRRRGMVGSGHRLVTRARPPLADRKTFAQQTAPEDAVPRHAHCVPTPSRSAWPTAGAALMRHGTGDGAWYGHDAALVGGASATSGIHRTVGWRWR